jgi:micrococcal nuclease
VSRAVLLGLALLAACARAETPTAPLEAHPNDPSSAPKPTATPSSAPGEAEPATPSSPPAVPGLVATVRQVIDGDTIDIAVGGQVDTVRLIGIDTPEKTGGLRAAECFGDEASAFAGQVMPEGSTVHLVRDTEARDQYDRLLAYVYRDDGTFVNLALVDRGYAAAYPFEPNTTFADDFRAAEERARRLGLGLWGRCGGSDVPAGSLGP